MFLKFQFYCTHRSRKEAVACSGFRCWSWSRPPPVGQNETHGIQYDFVPAEDTTYASPSADHEDEESHKQVTQNSNRDITTQKIVDFSF